MSSLTQALTIPVRVINNSHRSIRGTERAPLQSMPPSSSCFKVSIQNKKQNLPACLLFMWLQHSANITQGSTHSLYSPYFLGSLALLPSPLPWNLIFNWGALVDSPEVRNISFMLPMVRHDQKLSLSLLPQEVGLTCRFLKVGRPTSSPLWKPVQGWLMLTW